MPGASSNPTKQGWHPSSLLAYVTIPNDQDDFDSITSEVKSAMTAEARTDFYDRSLTVRRYTLASVAFSVIFSISCIIAGAIIIATHGVNGAIQYQFNASLQLEMLALPVVLDLIVTLCTGSAGLVHGISLRSALASESRLRFNTNLRLLTAAHGWRNPNGILLNGVMAVLLIISYTSASLVMLSPDLTLADNVNGVEVYLRIICITGLPLLLLGITLLLQVLIALLGMQAVKILTWSCSPFDVTAALVHHAQLTPVPLRCMCNMSELDAGACPAKPSEIQPSAWQAHRSIRKVILSLWVLVLACAGWAALATLIWNTTLRETESWIPSESWSFFPNGSGVLSWEFALSGGVTVRWWILVFVSLALVQGPLTLGLHCSELIANVIRDERYWRRANGRKGLRMATHPLKSFFTDPLGLVLFVAKPALHWMFGLSYNVRSGLVNGGGISLDGNIFQAGISMYTVQIWNLCIALFIFASLFTLIALYRPRGPQPAAYGHLQTLANLVDEWSPVMWWGHKEDGIPYCHAGTSGHLLPAVKMDCVYAGSSVGPHDLSVS
ncbi:hypothetical protein K503DRAFT_799067 [Rhizopogon vinicolor AM-OR11-026]|uniref:Uncharacterized protein n=1 Tax=Rhizopogon vinicolor AM-OR11-026 TaxID=1314800 RepID=A0A1B7N5I6_9AGAM|nr:hypothetical protein K503DRAFT_799067 [Rhizopogon vinicolor AM-OR11-026]